MLTGCCRRYRGRRDNTEQHDTVEYAEIVSAASDEAEHKQAAITGSGDHERVQYTTLCNDASQSAGQRDVIRLTTLADTGRLQQQPPHHQGPHPSSPTYANV